MAAAGGRPPAAAPAPAAAGAAGGATTSAGITLLQSLVPTLVAGLGLGGTQNAEFAARLKGMLASGFQPPPMPPALAAEMACLQPALAAMRSALAAGPLAADMARYQRAVAVLDPADPQFQQKFAQIHKPDMSAFAAPKVGPNFKYLKPGAARPSPPPPSGAAAGAAPSPVAASPAGPAGSEEERPGAGRPASSIQEVEVVCNVLAGTFLVERQMMACYCPQCKLKAAREGLRRIVVSPSEYERHAGMGQAKKWKWTVHTSDDKMTIGDWLTENGLDIPRGRLGRSPYAAKKRKEQQQAEEEEASRALLLGPRSARIGRGKRKRDGTEGDEGEEEEEEEDEEEGSMANDRSPERVQQGGSRGGTPPSGANPRARGAAAVAGGSNGAAAAGAEGAAGAAGEAPGSPAAPAAAVGAGQGGKKKHRQLRWIRRSETASPEPQDGRQGEDDMDQDFQNFQYKDEEMEEDMEEEEGGRQVGRTRSLSDLQADVAGPTQRRQALQPLPQVAHCRPVSVMGPEGRPLPMLMPLQRAAEAAEAAAAAAARQAAAAGSVVGPRLLGLPAVAIKRKGQQQRQRDDSTEPSGLRSPTGKPWLQSDHAFHEEHEGTDMRLGKQYQAQLPTYTGGPPRVLGPSGEAQEPMAPLPGPPEAEALASVAGPEKEQAASLPRDATADVWLREVADHVRATITGRQQRQRKQSRWLQETFDPNAVLGGKALVERQFTEDNAKDRFMLGRRGDADSRVAAEVEAAVASGASPEVLRWAVERYQDGRLAAEVQVSIGGVLFSGTLVPTVGGNGAGAPGLPRSRLGMGAGEAAAGGGGGGLSHAAAAGAAEPGGGRGLLPAVSGVSLGSGRDLGDTPRAPSLAGTAATGGGGGGGPGPSNLGPGPAAAAAAGAAGLGGQSYLEGESRPEGGADKGAERRAAAEARFQRLEAAGAPKGTKCALCHGTDTDDIPEASRGLGGRSQSGLGQMILVRVSAVAHAWVHDQCARWSPEVFDPEGDNRLEGMREAVRRGRMLRCKYCGDKGATLGCFKRTCRASYHLACSRKYNCLLQVEPYLVACPEHVGDLPVPYSAALAKRPPGPQPGQARAASAPGGGGGRGRGRGRGRGGRSRGGDDAADSDSQGEDDEAFEDSESDEEAEGEEAGSESEDETEQSGPEEAGKQRPEEKPRRQQRQQPRGAAAAPAAAAPAAAAAAAPGAKAGKEHGTDYLLKQLEAFAGKLEQQQQRKVAPPAPPAPPPRAPAAAPLPLPLPIPVIPGAPEPAPVAWTRERIVEGPQLRAELAAEVTHGTRAVVVNYEGEHFRFRAFHSADDVDDGVQADSDAILLLDSSLLPATAGWPHTHAFPDMPTARRVEAFTNLLLKTFGA
ncbi:hypothetical protein ABPG75_002950 [Micractinium tetrahymenae]